MLRVDGHSTGNMQLFIHKEKITNIIQNKDLQCFKSCISIEQRFYKKTNEFFFIFYFFPKTASFPRDFKGLLVSLTPKAARCCQRPGCLLGSFRPFQEGKVGQPEPKGCRAPQRDFLSSLVSCECLLHKTPFETHLSFAPRDFITGKLVQFFFLLTVSLT